MVSEAETMGAPPDAQRSDEDMEHKPEEMDAEHEVDELADEKPKKKRRVIKLSDKKYECPEKDCGKSYSRAEHLYRHQLNHTPKQIYRCDHPGCDRHFVRADLCARHKERHTAKGSHLQRKDAFNNSRLGDAAMSSPPSPSGRNTVSASPVETNHVFPHPPSAEQYVPPMEHSHSYTASSHDYAGHAIGLAPIHADSAGSLDPQLANGASHNNFPALNGAYGSSMMPPAPVSDRRYSFDASSVPNSQYSQRPASNAGSYNHPSTLNINTMQPPPSNATMYSQTYPSPSSTNFRSPSAYNGLPSLPPFGMPGQYSNTPNGARNSILSPPSIASTDEHPVPNSRSNSMADFNVIDMSNMGYTMPVFGNDLGGFNRSPPLVLNDELFASLFSTNGLAPDPIIPSPPGPEPMQLPHSYNMPLPKLEVDGTPTPAPPAAGAPSSPTTNGLDITMKESALSEKKRQRLVDLVMNRFGDPEKLPDRRSRDEIMDGCQHDPNHVMSLKMLKMFLASYWAHVHQQMPILHRPTFNPETCPDLLMIAMMCLGASCLEHTAENNQTARCAELSSFLAYHVRWEVFKDVEFRPTAKLWTFQTMLLLELFEKMYSTRNLHERAHIHHATTLIVMRRGSSLIGRSAIESPGGTSDPTRTPPGPDGTINTSGVNTPDADWNRWITAEATRRVAFAAFIIDSTHATLFGHSAIMSPHDLKLPLPCDEALWAATSGAEVSRVEASLAANGFKPLSFIEGLRRTLNGAKVRTNTFGRVILMAGLLNVSWHMNQRDLQVSSLGAGNTLGNSMRWRSSLTRAFDHWRTDFDDSLSKNEHWMQLVNPRSGTPVAGVTPSDRATANAARDNVFESRNCLHTLAHMAMHVDLIDCTVFAGSDRALGRVVTDQDRQAVQRRMREQWAPSARARDAVFYALRFLCEVLIPEDELAARRSHPLDGHPINSHPPLEPHFTYKASDDYLLNRPWVLYFAVLIVWSYGYALDGAIRPSNYQITSRHNQIHDMQRYLVRMGGVNSPDDLERLKDRNSCLGLLQLLRQCFREPRWELLHEASDLLGNCINMLTPGANTGIAANTPVADCAAR